MILEVEIKLNLPNLGGAYDTKIKIYDVYRQYATILPNMLRFGSDVAFSDLKNLLVNKMHQYDNRLQ